MPKNDKTASKSTTTPAKGSSTGKRSVGFNKDKERAHLAKTAYNVVQTATEQKKIFKCLNCKDSYVSEGAYIIHHKSCGIETCKSCTKDDISIPTYSSLAVIRGDRYASMNKRKVPWNPRFEVQKYLNVVVDEETGKTERHWVTVKKYANYRAMLDDDGETVIDESGENVQYIDQVEQNKEGDDQSIVD
jgi:hypothetical protein